MFQTCQNQPDFGSTKPKCATLKKVKSFLFFCFDFFRTTTRVTRYFIICFNNNNLTVYNNFTNFGIFKEISAIFGSLF